VDVMDVVVLVVKNKRAHLRRIQNISFCANDDGRERRESFYEVTFFDFLERGGFFFYISSSSHFDSLFIFSFNIALYGRRCLIDCSVIVKKVEEIDTSISSSWRSHHPQFSSPLEVDGENPSKK
jgi:hypothetical protein